MEVMVLLLFVGVVFVVGVSIAFVWTAKSGTFDHGERLALLPLESDEGVSTTTNEHTTELRRERDEVHESDTNDKKEIQ